MWPFVWQCSGRLICLLNFAPLASTSFALSVVRDVKENREQKIMAHDLFVLRYSGHARRTTVAKRNNLRRTSRSQPLAWKLVSFYWNSWVSISLRLFKSNFKHNKPNLLSPWLKCPRKSPATRTWANDLQCSEGVPTAAIHLSTKDSTSSTATHLYWSKLLPLVCKWRIFPAMRLHRNFVLFDNAAILEY